MTLEGEMRWAMHHLESALHAKGDDPARLSYWTRDDMRRLLPLAQALLEEAEANYERTWHGKDAA